MRTLACAIAAFVLMTTPVALCEDWELESCWYSEDSEAYDLDDVYLPAIDTGLVNGYAEALGLDTAQREAAIDIARAIEDQHLSVWVDHAERTQDEQYNVSYLDDSWWEQGHERRAAIASAYARERTKAVDLFHEDLRLLITPEQDGRWDLLEAERLRRNTLTRYGGVEGEQVDLAAVVLGLDLDEAVLERLRPVLGRYKQTMHDALTTRNRALRSLDNALEKNNDVEEDWDDIPWDDPEIEMHRETYRSRSEATEKDVLRHAMSAKTLCERVAAVNTSFREEIEGLLPRSDHESLVQTIDGEDDETNWFSLVQASDVRDRLLEFIEQGDVEWSTLDSEWERGRAESLRVRALTGRQVTQCEDLLERLVVDLEALGENPPKAYDAWYGRSEVSVSLSSFSGYVRLGRTDVDQPEWDWSTMDDADKNEVNDYQQAFNQIERRYMEELRSILTVRQRALLLERD